MPNNTIKVYYPSESQAVTPGQQVVLYEGQKCLGGAVIEKFIIKAAKKLIYKVVFMKKLTSTEIRQKWLDFFESKNHLVIESKSLIPVNDSSLLWINSGVATLKNYFSGKKVPPAFRLLIVKKP